MAVDCLSLFSFFFPTLRCQLHFSRYHFSRSFCISSTRRRTQELDYSGQTIQSSRLCPSCCRSTFSRSRLVLTAKIRFQTRQPRITTFGFTSVRATLGGSSRFSRQFVKRAEVTENWVRETANSVLIDELLWKGFARGDLRRTLAPGGPVSRSRSPVMHEFSLPHAIGHSMYFYFTRMETVE